MGVHSAVVVFASLLTWVALSKPAQPAVPAAAGHQAVSVQIARASREDVPVYLEGLGTVQAYNTITVTARVDGELQQVGFVEGQRVNKGDLIAQIDARPYEAALKQARAAQAKDAALLANAQSELHRYELLAPQNLASAQTIEAQRALVAQLRAQIDADSAVVDSATTQVGYTTIKSPIGGRTGIRRVDPGNIVRAADTKGIVVVTQVQPITCIFTLPDEALPQMVRALASGRVEVTALSRDGNAEFDHGTVALIDNQIDVNTGTIRIKAVFPNAHDTLWPGEFITARVLLQTMRSALTVPAAAIQRGPDGFYVYAMKSDSTVEVRPLRVLMETGDRAIVESGLQEGDRVVTSNHYRLAPGARVKDDLRGGM